MDNSDNTIEASISTTREKLNTVSPSFCLAKWLQVTLHLQNGRTHSCHHPIPHLIPLKELAKNKTALHNTLFKKNSRKEMLKGTRPKECDYCWNMENLGSHIISDRFIKSNDSWALPDFDKIKRLPWDTNVNPTYVEVSFSNTCNFKCAYCFPQISSKWMSEIQEFGPYPTLVRHQSLKFLKKSKLLPYASEDENPYVKAFWSWWPELYPTLKVFRITGGEPLLSSNTFKVLEHIIENPNPSLDLAINSNLGVPTELVRRFSEKIKTILEKKSVKQVRIYTSLDTWGTQAEYIRHGLSLDLFRRNLDLHFAMNPNVPVTIMCAFNLLSIFRFHELIDFTAQQRALGRQLYLDISYVRHPHFLDCRLLPEHFKAKASGLVALMKEKNFYQFEIIKMSRLAEFIESSLKPTKLRHERREFITFIEEHDRRRKTDFLKTFPELQEDFKQWSQLKKPRGIKPFIYRLLLG